MTPCPTCPHRKGFHCPVCWPKPKEKPHGDVETR